MAGARARLGLRQLQGLARRAYLFLACGWRSGRRLTQRAAKMRSPVPGVHQVALLRRNDFREDWVVAAGRWPRLEQRAHHQHCCIYRNRAVAAIPGQTLQVADAGVVHIQEQGLVVPIVTNLQSCGLAGASCKSCGGLGVSQHRPVPTTRMPRAALHPSPSLPQNGYSP